GNIGCLRRLVRTFSGEGAAGKVNIEREREERFAQIQTVGEEGVGISTARDVTRHHEEGTVPEVRYLERLDELTERSILTGEGDRLERTDPDSIRFGQWIAGAAFAEARERLCSAPRVNHTRVLRRRRRGELLRGDVPRWMRAASM